MKARSLSEELADLRTPKVLQSSYTILERSQSIDLLYAGSLTHWAAWLREELPH